MLNSDIYENCENVPNKNTRSKKRSDNYSEISCDSYLCSEEEPQWHFSHRRDFENDIDRPLCTHDLICWAFQVSRGMSYLASRRVYIFLSISFYNKCSCFTFYISDSSWRFSSKKYSIG